MISRWPLREMNFRCLALTFALASLPFSMMLSHAGLIAFVALWVMEGEWKEKLSRFRKNVSVQLLVVLGIILLAGLTYTEDMSQGAFFFERKIFFFLLPITIATTSKPLTRKEIRNMFWFFVAACFAAMAVCFIYAAYQFQLHSMSDASMTADIHYFDAETFPISSINEAWLFFSYTVLANGLSIHPAYLALYVAFCNLFLLSEIMGRCLSIHQKISIGILIALFSLFIVCLASRIIAISLLMIYVLLLIYYLTRPGSPIRSVMMLGLVAGIVLLLYINPVSRHRSWYEIVNTSLSVSESHRYNNSVEIRASLWWLGWKSFQDHNPLTGAGTGDVNDEMSEAAAEYSITNKLNSVNPHNQYLYILIANGVPALVVFLLYLLLPFLRAWFRSDYLMMAFTFLFASLCFTETALELQKGIVFFAIVHSLLAFQWNAAPAHLNRLSSASN